MRPSPVSTTPSARNRRRSRPRKTDQLKIMQPQAGHAWGSTTALYTNVGSDFMNNALHDVLGRQLTGPTASTAGANGAGR